MRGSWVEHRDLLRRQREGEPIAALTSKTPAPSVCIRRWLGRPEGPGDVEHQAQLDRVPTASSRRHLTMRAEGRGQGGSYFPAAFALGGLRRWRFFLRRRLFHKASFGEPIACGAADNPGTRLHPVRFGTDASLRESGGGSKAGLGPGLSGLRSEVGACAEPPCYILEPSLARAGKQWSGHGFHTRPGPNGGHSSNRLRD